MNTPAKIHPLSNDLLIIYVIGGMTSYEYKLVKEVFNKESPGKNVKKVFFNHKILLIKKIQFFKKGFNR
jgi:hypothetical protein